MVKNEESNKSIAWYGLLCHGIKTLFFLFIKIIFKRRLFDSPHFNILIQTNVTS